MIDIKFLRENPDIVKENIRKKFQWAGIRSPDLGESEGEMVCR